jgi:hypothetical protein
MSGLPWNSRKFSCKIYPSPWNFHLKFGHGISMCKFIPLPMEFPSWEIYPSLWKFHVRITPPLGIPEPECPLPWKFQG